MPSFMAIFPDVLLLILGILILVIEPFLRTNVSRSRFLGLSSVIGLSVILIANLWLARPAGPRVVFGEMLRFDLPSFWFKTFFLFAAWVTAWFFMSEVRLRHRAEAYLLLLAATLGMCLMASATDLVMVYLAIETTSIPLYVLAGFLKDEDKSTEAGFKYLLFGALTSAVLLYGLSLLVGITGKTDFYSLSAYFDGFNLVSGGIVFLVLVGLAFKVSLFPFHFWAPDVYEGAPTPVVGFLSTASKAAGFIVLMRLFTTVFSPLHTDWSWILAILSALTMTVGNLAALVQRNIKRMLAYSSIAHAGYALMGLVAFSQHGLASLMFYLLSYLVMNLLAFGIVSIVGLEAGADDMEAYYGLSRRNAGLTLALLVTLLSLAGMPPFAGFVAKFVIFNAAVEQGWIWLVVVGVLNSVVGLYYYLTVLKYAYLYRLPGEDESRRLIPMSFSSKLMVGGLALGILILGALFTPWVNWALRAVQHLL